MSTTTSKPEGADDRDEWESMSDEEKLELLRNKITREDAFTSQVLKPKVQQLENEVDELRAENEQLHEEVDRLEGEIDDLAGVGENQQSTREKRSQDLRQLLKNKARADYEGAGDGKIAWKYRTVINQLESNGHGTVYPAQAYDAMDDAGRNEGYGTGTDAEGEKVVRVDYTELPSQKPVNEINNENGVSQPATDAVIE